MEKLRKLLPVFAAALVLAATTSIMLAQETGQSQPMVMRGQLMDVDTSNQILTIKSEDGQAIDFRYNSDTKVEGAEDSIQGLASDKGTDVTVQYREENGQRLAERIQVKKIPRG